MSEIEKKRDMIEILNRLILIMSEEEVNALAITTNSIIEHMIKRGVEVK
ncbi:MAG: hypothetical protein ACRDD7_11765 [Peptostreptococcaceae bacterium]